MKYVCVEYVNFPSEPRNWDLGSIDNPLHQACNVAAITDRTEAESWLADHTANAGIFPLRSLTPAMQARARRAVARRLEYA